MKTLILNPTKPPFTNVIDTQRAVEFRTIDQPATEVEARKAMALMFANLLNELHDSGCIDHHVIGRVLDLEVTGIETFNTHPSPAL